MTDSVYAMLITYTETSTMLEVATTPHGKEDQLAAVSASHHVVKQETATLRNTYPR